MRLRDGAHDATTAWQHAGNVAKASELSNVTKLALARFKQLKSAVSERNEEYRPPTPQFAAKRDISDLPPGFPYFPPLKKELSLRYFTPPGAARKLPAYIYHEPGDKVRESLAKLAEQRRSESVSQLMRKRHEDDISKGKLLWNRVRATEAVNDAAAVIQRAYRKVDEWKKESGKAACTIQSGYRGKAARKRALYKRQTYKAPQGPRYSLTGRRLK